MQSEDAVIKSNTRGSAVAEGPRDA